MSTTVSGLIPGTIYYSRVRARDAAGNLGTYSQVVSATTLQQTAPFDFSLLASNPPSVSQGNSLPILVTANLVSGNAQPITFSVGTLPPGVTATITPQSCTVTCSATIYLTTSISTPLQQHTILITASGGGITRTSQVIFTVTPLIDSTPPSAVSQASTSVIDSDTIQLSWGAATDNVGVTGYLVDVSPSVNFANYVTGWFNRDLGTQLLTQVNDLAPSTTYYSRVRARDAAGNLGTYSQVVFATTLQQTQPLQIPTLPLVTSASYDSASGFILLTWTDSLREQSYVMQRSQGGGEFSTIAILPTDTTSYIDYAIAQNIAYIYRLRAVNSAGNSPYSFGSVSTIVATQTTQTTTTTTTTNVPGSDVLIVTQPSQYLSGGIKYSWGIAHDEVKVIVNELPPIDYIELHEYGNNPSREILVSNYGSATDFPEEIASNYELKYFFAIDAKSFIGDIILNLKIPLIELNGNLVFVAISEEEGLWNIEQTEMIRQDDSFAYYSIKIPAEARYAVAVGKTDKNNYWDIVIIAVIIFAAIVIITLVRKLKKRKIEWHNVNSILLGNYRQRLQPQ